jgi:DNA replication protein DnaC
MSDGSTAAPVPVGKLVVDWIERFKNYQPTPEEMEIMKQREEEEKRRKLIEKRKLEVARLISLRIPLRYQGLSLENYSVASTEQGKVVAFLREYASRSLREMENLIIHGPPGTGKTHMICAFIQGFPSGKAQYWKLSDIMRTIKDSYSPNGEGTELSFLKQLSRVPVLVIDEIGRQAGSNFEGGTMFDLLDDRYDNLLPTILISNLPVEGKKPGEPSMTSYLGISVMDRINEHSLDIPCMWGNYRDHAEITIRERIQ